MSKKILSIIIPAYNEEVTIVTLLDKVLKVKVSLKKEIIIVNDGSTDSTRALIEEWQATKTFSKNETVIIIDKKNGGKGSAVRAGIEKSTGDVVIIQDADLEYDPNDYQKCIDPILRGKTKVVYGSRGRVRLHSSLVFYIGGLMVTYWMNLLFGTSLTDEPTCYKTFDGNLIRTLLFKGSDFRWEPEITAKLLRLGYEIYEVPIKYMPRKMTEGKKISWKDGIIALWTAFLWRFWSINKEKAVLLKIPSEKNNILSQLKEQKILYLLILVSLFIRLLIILPGMQYPEKTFFRPDSSSYIQPALALLETGSYNESPSSTNPATVRSPGFPVFLAGLFVISNYSLGFPVLIFCLISAITCIPIFYAGKLFGKTAAIGAIAALLFGFNITSIAVAPLYLSDTLFTFFAAWQFYFFTRFYCKERLLDLWVAIFLNGVATLIRPTGLFWIIPCLFLLLIFTRKTLIKRLIGVIGCIVVFAILIIPWMARNHMVGAGFRLDTNIGNSFYYYISAAVVSTVTGESTEILRQKWGKETTQEFAAHPEKYPDENSRVQYKLAKAKKIIHQYPLAYLRQLFRPTILLPDVPTFFELLGLTQTGRGTLDILNQKGLIAAVQHYFNDKIWLLSFMLPGLLVVVITYLGCGVKLCCWIIQKKWFLLFFFMAFVPYYLVQPGPIVMPRYHLPALPMMTVMAAMTIGSLWEKWKFRK